MWFTHPEHLIEYAFNYCIYFPYLPERLNRSPSPLLLFPSQATPPSACDGLLLPVNSNHESPAHLPKPPQMPFPPCCYSN